MQMDSRSFDFSQDRFRGNDRGNIESFDRAQDRYRTRNKNVEGRLFAALRMTGKGKKLNYGN